VFWINGVEAGSHDGGHTEYFFDITKLVRTGENLIAVELDKPAHVDDYPRPGK